jgi:hypothetical protein
MTTAQRIHLQELFNKKHLAVVEAYKDNPRDPNLLESSFVDFLIEKYQTFISVPRETALGKK